MDGKILICSGNFLCLMIDHCTGDHVMKIQIQLQTILKSSEG